VTISRSTRNRGDNSIVKPRGKLMKLAEPGIAFVSNPKIRGSRKVAWGG